MTKIKQILDHLNTRDPKLKKILDRNMQCPILEQPNFSEEYLFFQLSRTIIGQQLSVAAAKSIWERLAKRGMSPSRFIVKIQRLNINQHTKYGVSRMKLSYIKNIAKKIRKNELLLSSLVKMNDKQAIENLTSLKGVGKWTAEMFLIFCLKRKDIFSEGDSGLRRAITSLYKLDKFSKKKLNSIVKKWSPYRSIVSWYLWKALDTGLLKK